MRIEVVPPLRQVVRSMRKGKALVVAAVVVVVVAAATVVDPVAAV